MQPPDSLDPVEDPSCCWLSAHIYFRGDVYGASCDRVAVEVAEPFVRQCEQYHWCQRYFFIRYGDAAGSHVRLRLFGDQATLERKVRPALLHHVATHLPADLTMALPPEAPGQDAAETVPVRWIAYEPETERYGGPEGVTLAEWFFYHSSEASLALLKPVLGHPRSARLGKGLLSMLVLLHTFLDDPEAVAGLCYQYATGYLQARITDEQTRSAWTEAFDAGYTRQADHLGDVVEAVWDVLGGSGSLNEALDPYRQGLLSIKSRLVALQQQGRLRFDAKPLATPTQALRALVPNYLHMTNNRLGITIPEEAYLAHLIRHTLGQHTTSSLP